MSNNNWDVSDPINHLRIGSIPQEIRGVESATKHIIKKEHVTPSTGGAGGQHKKGSARVYLQSGIPATDPEGNSLATADTSDNGRLLVLTGSSNLLKVYVASGDGVSTGFQNIKVARITLAEQGGMNFAGFVGVNAGSGTQAGQPIHAGQFNTDYFAGLSTGLLLPRLVSKYLAASGHDGIVVAKSKIATDVEESYGKFYLGSYIGDNQVGRQITGVGFQPDFLLLLMLVYNAPFTTMFFKTANMGNKTLTEGGGYASEYIVSLDFDGFTLGSSANTVNISGISYDFIALKAG